MFFNDLRRHGKLAAKRHPMYEKNKFGKVFLPAASHKEKQALRKKRIFRSSLIVISLTIIIFAVNYFYFFLKIVI
jgi:hypothetical protein